MPSHAYTGTVTVITNKPEAPRGASVRAASWGVAAAKAVRIALKRRRAELGPGTRGKTPTRIVVALARHPEPITPEER